MAYSEYYPHPYDKERWYRTGKAAVGNTEIYPCEYDHIRFTSLGRKIHSSVCFNICNSVKSASSSQSYQSSTPQKTDTHNYFQERVYKPQSHNDKVFTLAKEVRTQELKQKMYKDMFYIENVYTKAERAIEDRYVTSLSVYELAQEIINLIQFVDDNKIMRTIVVEADIDDRLYEIKSEYHKFNITLN